jgi:hypothetical protein
MKNHRALLIGLLSLTLFCGLLKGTVVPHIGKAVGVVPPTF